MVKTEIEGSFPSSLELIAASALLTLSSLPPKNESENGVTPPSFSSSRVSISKSSGESSIMETCEDASRSLHLTVVAYLPEAHDLKLKIVKKKRSKCISISKSKKMKSIKQEPSDSTFETASEITTADTSSCILSSSSTTAQSCRNTTDKLRDKVAISGHMEHKAAAIRQVLSYGSASEMRIRELLGDSPSTSKALRLLLRLQEVKRSGAGGRGDPYIYMIAS